MKRFIIITAIAALCVGTVYARGVLQDDKRAVLDFTAVQDKSWTLVEIAHESGSILLDRNAYQATNHGDIFTIQFSKDGQFSGKASPNHYRGTYTFGVHQSLSLGQAAATLMMDLNAPSELSESTYFAYLSSVQRWELIGSTLGLETRDAEGNALLLIFN
ncbi:MAG: META domain-containing protein [Treponema sp.]|jgi:heat shock protein HslJ|nr:META domain-containing protein [Treponema sp.]